MHPTHVPLRLVTGAFILNSGLNKWGADEQTAVGLHGMASGAYPVFSSLEPKDFAQVLAASEITLGAALLFPKVPSAAVGAALAGFGAGLVGMYLKTPGMTQEDGIRPTADGIGLAKDVWLVGAGLTLATQGFLSGAKSAAKSASKSARSKVSDIGQSARDTLPFSA